MSIAEDLSNYKSQDVSKISYLHKAFDYKSIKDWVVLGLMSVPIIVLSILGSLFLIQLLNTPK